MTATRLAPLRRRREAPNEGFRSGNGISRVVASLQAKPTVNRRATGRSHARVEGQKDGGKIDI